MVKKGRHRRYEEARALKRNNSADDIEAIMDRLEDDPFDFSTPSSSGDSDADGSDTDDYDDQNDYESGPKASDYGYDDPDDSAANSGSEEPAPEGVVGEEPSLSDEASNK